MSEHEPTQKSVIDVHDGVASLTFYDAGATVSVYTFNAKTMKVTMDAREVFSITLAQATSGGLRIDEWITNIEKEWQPSRWPQKKWHVELEQLVTKVKIETKVDGVSLTDDEWVEETGMITYGERPEVELEWADFIHRRMWQKRFLEACRNFGRIA